MNEAQDWFLQNTPQAAAPPVATPAQPAAPVQSSAPSGDWFDSVAPESSGVSVDSNVPDLARIADKDKGAGPALKRSNPLMIPVNLANAFVPSDKPEDLDETNSAKVLSNSTGLPLPLALALHRIIIAPMLREHETAKAYETIARSKGDNSSITPPDLKSDLKKLPLMALGPLGMLVGNQMQPDISEAQHRANEHHIASAVPLLGPLAESIMEHFHQGDKSGAVAELISNIVGGKILEGAGKAGLKKIAPQVRTIAGEKVPVLASQAGDKGAHLAEQGTKLAGVSGEHQLKKFGVEQGEAAQRSMSNMARDTAIKTGEDLEANSIQAEPGSASEQQGPISLGNRSKPLPNSFKMEPEESVNGSSLSMRDEAGNEMGSIGLRDSSAIPGKIASEISDVQLHKYNRGQGYGQALYEEAAKHAAGNGDDFLVSSGKPTDLANDTWKRLEQAHPEDINFVNGRWQWNLKPSSGGNPLTMAPEALEKITDSKAALASSSSFGEAAENIRAAAGQHFKMLDEATNGELSALKAERSDLFKQLRNPANDASVIRKQLADVAKREDEVFDGNGVGQGRTALDAARRAWKKSYALDELDARISRVTKETMGPGGIDKPLARQVRGSGLLKQLDQMDPDKLKMALGDPEHVKSLRTLAALLENGQNVSKMTISMRLLRGSRLFGVMHHPVAVAGSEGLSYMMGKILTSPTLSGTMGKMLKAGSTAPMIASALAKAMESQNQDEAPDVD